MNREFFIRSLDFPKGVYFKLLTMSIGRTDQEFIEMCLQYLRELTEDWGDDPNTINDYDYQSRSDLKGHIEYLEEQLESAYSEGFKDGKAEFDGVDKKLNDMSKEIETLQCMTDFLTQVKKDDINLHAPFFVIENQRHCIVEEIGAFNTQWLAQEKIRTLESQEQYTIKEYTLYKLLELIRMDKGFAWKVGRLYKMYSSTMLDEGTDIEEVIKIRQKVFV